MCTSTSKVVLSESTQCGRHCWAHAHLAMSALAPHSQPAMDRPWRVRDRGPHKARKHKAALWDPVYVVSELTQGTLGQDTLQRLRLLKQTAGPQLGGQPGPRRGALAPDIARRSGPEWLLRELPQRGPRKAVGLS